MKETGNARPAVSNYIERLSDRSIALALFFLTFSFFAVFALMLNIPPVIDEVTGLANSAYMRGYDWRDSVYAMGNYYFKPVGNILYYPLFLVFKDSYALYKAILVLNMAIIGFVPVFAYKILTKHLAVSSKITAALSALAVGTLPSTVLYSMYARADVLLIFIAWPLVYVFLEGFDAQTSGRRTWLSIVAGALATFGYMTHTRGAVLIIALFLTMLVMKLLTGKSPLSFFMTACSTVFFVLTDILLCAVFKEAVYIASTEHSSVESFDFAYLSHLFTGSGILSMLKRLLGWVFNVIVSTYGLVIIGAVVTVYLFVRTVRMRRKEEQGSSEKLLAFSVFSLLNFLGTTAMGALFFFKYADWYYKGLYVMRADRFIYGRYTACAVGGLVLLGIYALFIKRSLTGLKTKLASAGAYLLISGVFLWKAAPYLAEGQACTRYFMSLCTFLGLPSEGATTALFPDIVAALAWAALLGFVVYVVLLVLSGIATKGETPNKYTHLALAFALLASIIIFSVNYYKLRLARDEKLVNTVSQAADFIETQASLSDEYPYVLVLQSAGDIKHYQAVCKEFKVGDCSTAASDADNCFVVGKKGAFLAQYYEDDYFLIDGFDYEDGSHDIVYIKGSALADRLEAAGVKLSRFDGKLKKTVDEKKSTVTPDNTK